MVRFGDAMHGVGFGLVWLRYHVCPMAHIGCMNTGSLATLGGLEGWRDVTYA